MKSYSLILIVVLLTIGCNQERNVDSSFYYWQQRFNLSNLEKKYLNELKVNRLYIKFFDVVWDASANISKPAAIINFQDTLPENIEIIPTIYITNETISKSNEPEIIQLAERTNKKIKDILKKYNLNSIQETQIDCDWSLSTRDKFFLFLEKLKAEDISLELSATIRLHQIKFYKKTGIPPVDKGMLMFYNMGDLKNADTKNSILDLDIAQQYLTNFDEYQLPLDIALPIFRWGVLKRRERVVKLINNLNISDLQDTTKYEAVSDINFKVKSSHYLNGYYLYPNDEIRIEQVSFEELEKTKELLKKQLQNQELTVTYYHLDDAVLEFYPEEDLKAITNGFK